MATQTLLISTLRAECDEAWLRREVKCAAIIVGVEVKKPGEVEKHGITLVAAFAGSGAEADSFVSRFSGANIGGRKVGLYAPIFSH